MAEGKISPVPEIRAGIQQATGLSTTSKIISVTFNSPMPSTDYSVTLAINFAAYYNAVRTCVSDKTVNGFSFRAVVETTSDPSSVVFNFNWIAVMNR